MKFPDIGAYLESFTYPEGRFNVLRKLKTQFNRRGEMDFTAGSGSVVFRAECGDKTVAVKCFTKFRQHRPEHYQTIRELAKGGYLSSVEFLDEEVYVFDEAGNGAWYPVVLSEWIEGVSLGARLQELRGIRNKEGLKILSKAFDEMALWLLKQNFAHGDLKPDNLLATPDGQLKLIDYDAFFTPDKAGSLSPELGTPGFQHPGRTQKFFDRTIDDYSIALMSVALHALADCPAGYDGHVHSERLLFDPAEAVGHTSEILNRVKSGWFDRGQTTLYRLACQLHSSVPGLPELAGLLEQIVQSGEEIPTAQSKTDWTVFRENGCYGFRNETTRAVIDAVYDDAQEFSEGLAAVKAGKRWRYIDEQGRLAIDASAYDKVGSFHEGRAVVNKGKKWGYLDLNGQAAIPLQWESARRFSEGLAAVKEKGQWGYIDPQGNTILPCRFESAFDFREGTAVVGENGRFGYIDSRGEWLVKPQYTFASGFRNGEATAEIDGRGVRLVKRDNRIEETEST